MAETFGAEPNNLNNEEQPLTRIANSRTEINGEINKSPKNQMDTLGTETTSK